VAEQKEIHGFVVTRAADLTDEQRENNRKWVDALRSGRYSQSQYELRNAEGYCCLGVCEDALGCSWEWKEATNLFHAVRGKERSTNVLTRSCTDLIGASRYDFDEEGDANCMGFTVTDRSGSERDLDHLNDVVGLSFAQIADMVAYRSGLEDAPASTDKEVGEGA
jgi:hypothetical protein